MPRQRATNAAAWRRRLGGEEPAAYSPWCSSWRNTSMRARRTVQAKAPCRRRAPPPRRLHREAALLPKTWCWPHGTPPPRARNFLPRAPPEGGKTCRRSSSLDSPPRFFLHEARRSASKSHKQRCIAMQNRFQQLQFDCQTPAGFAARISRFCASSLFWPRGLFLCRGLYLGPFGSGTRCHRPSNKRYAP